MITYSGTSVFPNDLGVPTLGDVGVGLGRQSRFAGQTRLYYPVLAHVLMVADIMPQQYAIYGLLHDAPEAIMSDVPTPWKCQQVRDDEHMLYERIVRHYELPWPIPEHVQEAVHKADYEALVTEAYVLGHPRPEVMHGGGEIPEFVEQYAPLVDAYRRRACTIFVPPNEPDEATLAFHEPEIAGRIYTESFDHLLAHFDPAPLED